MANKGKNRSEIAVAIFLCYGIVMLYLLFIWDRTIVQDVSYWDRVRGNSNFIPLHTIGNYWHVLTHREYYLEKWQAYAIYRYHARHAFINLVGNVALFVPLGAFLPAVSKKRCGFWRTLLRSTGLIVAVEVLQLFTLLGSCDVDDLILNLSGVILGWLLWRLWQRIN